MICPVDTCGRSMPAVAAICGACQADLRRALAAVPDVARDLDLTLSRQTSKTGGGRSSVVPLVFDPRASEASYVLRSTIEAWTRAMAEGVTRRTGPACRSCTHPSCRLLVYSRGPGDTLAGMAGWLSAGLRRLARHPAAQEAAEEIVTAVAAAQRIVDRRPDRQFAGRCECGAVLYARPGASTVQCRDCDADPVQVAGQLDQMRARVRDQLAHAYGVAALLARLDIKAPESTIRRWAKQGRLISHGTDKRGRRLYRVGDVLDIAINDIQRGPTRLRTTQRGA